MSGFQPIRRLAIANRGESAMRCIRAVKALRAQEGSDLQAVALYTEVERDAPFVRHADLAVRLAGVGVAAYLDHGALIDAIRSVDADAVWPGWGFVAEDPAFVDRLAEEGIRFLGPQADAMRALGDKIGSKHLAESVAVPVTAWSRGVLETAEDARRHSEAIGFPVVVKASAGGGGRGIRVVDDPADLETAFASAASEAQAAFGDGRLFVEKKVVGGRHIEVQIAADLYGNVHAVGTRDCSVQRRHQKVLEEAPPPGLAPAVLQGIQDSATKIAREVGYAGVGTVEFLVSGDEYSFLEMNPRLQVEHGITEEITGIDLVQTQIRIARGESLADLVIVEQGHAIEARVCAEDPDKGFLPAPGRIARFEPALGPRIRVDTGVASGSVVPAAFDSLIAKVIATGSTREEARARLVAALADFDLVIEGGATNKGYIAEILEHPDYRRGAVDTTWLDRFGDARSHDAGHDASALVTAAILTYQRNRANERLNFFADASNLSRVGASQGQEIDLSYEGEQYRLQVFALGAWRYRVHLDSRVVGATLREEGAHTARLEIGDETLRILYDVGDVGMRVEVEGRAYAFSSQTAGQVRAGAPAMVVTIHVQPGDVVKGGQALGVLEAMKMEVGFDAPVAGVVTEVRVRKGEQVAAGDVILVIDPQADGDEEAGAARIALAELDDPLEPLFAPMQGEPLGVPDLSAADRAPLAQRRSAIAGVREETRRVLLGYDANPGRADALGRFLEAEVPDDVSDAFCWELAEIRSELVALADVARLFIRAPGASIAGDHGPSNEARLRMYARRVRAGGAGLDEAYLDLVRAALGHYGIGSLTPNDAVERAVLRLLATQRQPELRDRLGLAMLRRLVALARRGVHMSGDAVLARALDAVSGMRGLVSHLVADAAIEAHYEIFERPEVETQAERTTKGVQGWLDTAASQPTAPPERVLRDLADARRAVFDRVGGWVSDPDPRRRAIALAAHLRRAFSPEIPVEQATIREGEHWLERMELPGGRVVIGGACAPETLASTAAHLMDEARRGRESHEWPSVHALELFTRTESEDDALDVEAALAPLLGDGLPAGRLTVTEVRDHAPDRHRTFLPTPTGYREDARLHGLHPEAADRVDLERLSGFDLEAVATSEGIYAFHGRAKDEPGDERIFVLADLRTRSPEDGHEADLHLPAFEHAFHEATRLLRSILRERDPKRRLQWNRIAIYLGAEVFLGPEVSERLSRKLAPATRNLGLEKVVARLRTLDRDAPERPSRELEVVISNVTGMSMTILMREPRRSVLLPHSDYERKVVDARRRRLVYPYEIVRMLTGSGRAASGVDPDLDLPAGDFEEYDLDPAAPTPTAVSVSGRAYGENTCGVVIGRITTPTEKVPEGMERVIVLSDPTRGMGSLAGAECDRIVAAIDLAEKRGVPLEWIPVSSGARIAMDSGTENLDATARVVRRIIEFTQTGGTIHLIIAGVNVGAQSYWDALSTMLMHTRGVLIMTQNASMVLTGRAALEASGSVSAEDEAAIGGFERIMGPNGQAQYFAGDLAEAFRILYEHYRYTYVVPGEAGPRGTESGDPATRSVGEHTIETTSEFSSVGEIFSGESNPGRKRPFSMRAVMHAVIDQDGGHLERWRSWVGAETAIVWDAHLGGDPVCLVGIESQNVSRDGFRPHDGPDAWNGGTLFPQSSKKVARALNAASGNRPVVILANLSGFDGSPESMRKLQLEYGAEIARAVVNFDGPILFLVVSRYHGGAYVVFSRALNPRLRASALEGSYASVIGGGPAAKVVFGREVRARAVADPRVVELARERDQSDAARLAYERGYADVLLEKQQEMAEEFDRIHSVERAREVGSLEEIVAPADMRAYLIGLLDDEAG